MHEDQQMIDMRSDFVSRPTGAMIEAMMSAAAAPVGFGAREDPTVMALEQRVAEMLGKEDALFCPTCSGANQIAIRALTLPGDTVVCAHDAHIITSELTAPAILSGVHVEGVEALWGKPSIDSLEAAVLRAAGRRSRPSLLVMENTHVRSGGRILFLDYMSEVSQLAQASGASIHLDGSRLFNASVALGVDVAALARSVNTVSVSLNKGLGAPLGAVLAGDRDLIREADRLRQIFGSAWRPANIPAAAGLVALDTMVERLVEDHEVAKHLAGRLENVPGLTINPADVETNILLLEIDDAFAKPQQVESALLSHGIQTLPFGEKLLRLVVWHGIGITEANIVASALQRTMQNLVGCRNRD